MKFERLTVIGIGEPYIGKGGKKQNRWLCKCDCGSEKNILATNYKLTKSKIRSCGCLQIERVKEVNSRLNEYILDEKYGKGLTNNNNNEFIFDLEDFDKINKYCWKDSHGYIATHDPEKRKNISLHRYLMNFPKNKCVDHINHNKYDNRKENLRITSKSQNCMNQKISSRNKSGVTGVLLEPRSGNWTVKITANKKIVHLGTYKNFDDAVSVRKEAEEKYFGEFSYYNSMNKNN